MTGIPKTGAPTTNSPITGAAPHTLRIGNASGFYGDRFDALREMLTGGPLDVLTGDYLAELTMLILGRDRQRDPAAGYAKTFLRQLEEGLGLAHERGVKIVANAGGLNPAGHAAAVRALAERVGVPVRVAHVEGDDLLTKGSWGDGVLTANAYLGGAGIAACLRAGADIVVTGRVTDAALVTGPAAAHFGWAPDDLDALVGAVVARHVLECGTQATGGNYALFTDHDPRRLRHPGFPLAEIRADGTAVITKHPGTGGVVDLGTVTAQLLYETGGARYAGPDVTARLDTVRLTPDGPDRVRISGVRGEPPPPTLKVGLNRIGGWRNEVVFVLTGLDIEAKADLVRDQVTDALGATRGNGNTPPAEVRWELARTDHADAPTEETASALLRLVVRDSDPDAVGRAVSGAVVELALGSYPGFHVTAPPGRAPPTGCSSPRMSTRRRSTTSPFCRTASGCGYQLPYKPRSLTLSQSPSTTCPNPSPPASPPSPRPSASSRAPAAATRAATPTSASGPGARAPGGGWRTS